MRRLSIYTSFVLSVICMLLCHFAYGGYSYPTDIFPYLENNHGSELEYCENMKAQESMVDEIRNNCKKSRKTCSNLCEKILPDDFENLKSEIIDELFSKYDECFEDENIDKCASKICDFSPATKKPKEIYNDALKKELAGAQLLLAYMNLCVYEERIPRGMFERTAICEFEDLKEAFKQFENLDIEIDPYIQESYIKKMWTYLSSKNKDSLNKKIFEEGKRVYFDAFRNKHEKLEQREPTLIKNYEILIEIYADLAKGTDKKSLLEDAHSVCSMLGKCKNFGKKDKENEL